MEAMSSLATFITNTPTIILLAALIIGSVIILFAVWYVVYVMALPAVSVISILKIMFKRHREKKAESVTSRKSYSAPTYQLGHTMADGGDKIEAKNSSEEKK